LDPNTSVFSAAKYAVFQICTKLQVKSPLLFLSEVLGEKIDFFLICGRDTHLQQEVSEYSDR